MKNKNPLSLPTLSGFINPTPSQTRLGAPVRARADGRDFALDGFGREVLAEGRVDEVEGEARGEDLSHVQSSGVIGVEGRDKLGVCAACL